MSTKRCRCCGSSCAAAEATRSNDPEWSTCRACVDAGCTPIPDTNGGQRRGALCPLVVQAGEDGADAVIIGTALDVGT